MDDKTQVLFIHGGMTFKNKEDYIDFLKNRPISIDQKDRWSGDYLNKKISGDANLIAPKMPLKEDSKYEEWKIHFERYLNFLEDNIILIGESLGGIFLAKYLSENKFPKKILSVYLIAPPYDNTLIRGDLVGGFELKEDLSFIWKNSDKLTLIFSKDDPSVPVSHAEKYKSKLPNAEFIIYESKNGHFYVSEFPELIEMIKKDLEIINI